jgi:hypothetical protein
MGVDDPASRGPRPRLLTVITPTDDRRDPITKLFINHFCCRTSSTVTTVSLACDGLSTVSKACRRRPTAMRAEMNRPGDVRQ